MPRQGAPEPLESRLEFETLTSDLSSRFANLPAAEVDSRMEEAPRRVCGFLGVDRSVLWQRSITALSVFTPTHIHVAQEVPGPVESPRHDGYPWLQQQMLAGRTVVLSSPEDLPAEAAVDRETARRLGVQSGVILPLSAGGEFVGVLTFTTQRAQRDWPDALVKRLQLVAQVFTSALLRRRHELSLQERDARLSAAADLAGLAFYEADFAKGTVFMDDRFREICGIPPEREEGLQPMEFWLEHLHPDDRERVLDLRQQMQDGRLERVSFEYRYLHPDQGEKWLHHLSRVAARDATGRMGRTHGVLRDIRETRQREEELLHRTTVMVNQYYFYGIEADFGPFFLKFSSYFPYTAKFCLNGHEYLKCQLTREGMPMKS